MKIILPIVGVLIALFGIGYLTGKSYFTVQVAYILIFACILVGAWLVLRFIQRN